jgi:hypothetical protein
LHGLIVLVSANDGFSVKCERFPASINFARREQSLTQIFARMWGDLHHGGLICGMSKYLAVDIGLRHLYQMAAMRTIKYKNFRELIEFDGHFSI